MPYLKVYAYLIRRKLGDENGRFLLSDPSVGYRLASRVLRPTERWCPQRGLAQKGIGCARSSA